MKQKIYIYTRLKRNCVTICETWYSYIHLNEDHTTHNIADPPTTALMTCSQHSPAVNRIPTPYIQYHGNNGPMKCGRGEIHTTYKNAIVQAAVLTFGSFMVRSFGKECGRRASNEVYGGVHSNVCGITMIRFTGTYNNFPPCLESEASAHGTATPTS